MYHIQDKLYYETETEAKLHLLILCDQDDKNMINRVKKSVESHEPLKTLTIYLTENYANNPLLCKFIMDVKRSHLPLLEVDLLNKHPSICSLDTFISSHLLLNPTCAMKAAAAKVSDVLIKTIKTALREKKENLSKKGYGMFALSLIFDFANTYPGGFTLCEINQRIEIHNKNSQNTINPIQNLDNIDNAQIIFILDEIIKKIQAPDASLTSIMNFHTQYSYYLLKFEAMTTTIENKKFDEEAFPYFSLIQNNLPFINSIEEFYKSLRDPKKKFYKCRAIISDDLMSYSKYYNEKHTSVLGVNYEIKTNILGIMPRVSNSAYRENLKFFDPPRVDWTNCKFSRDSIIVHSMLTHETPFVSSYSGTTALLVNLMEQTAQFQSLKEKQIYIQNIMAYIVGMGFHSIHEVISPISHCIKLIPQEYYPTEIPSLSAKVIPNYHGYFKLCSENDPEFVEKRNQSWSNLLNWFKEVYLKNNYLDEITILKQLISLYEKKQNKELLSDIKTFNKKHLLLEELMSQKIWMAIEQSYTSRDTPTEKVENDEPPNPFFKKY